jgi:colicin import membrane protein
VPFGLTLSILLHGGALAWMYLAMLATPPLKAPEPAPIEVALITPSDLLALKKGSTTATELEAKAKDEPKPEMSKLEAEKPKPILAPELPVEPTPPEPEKKVEEAPPPPEPPKAEPPKPDPIAEKLAAMPPEPPPGPTPDELKKVEEEKKAEEVRQAEEKKKAEDEKKKAEEEKKKADEKKKAEEREKARKKKLAEQKKKELEKKKKQEQADRLAALLDKDPTRKGAPNSATEPTEPTDYTGPTAGAAEGDAPRLSVREQDLLRAQISQQLRACWKLPGGGGGIETMVVTVRWRLRPDGSLEGEPAIEAPQAGPVFQIAAEAAVRAVKSCSPFTLPQDRYWAWKSIIWDFDPREML